MTPQAKRAPAFPVDFDSSWPPSPKSSTSAWTTTVRPKMLLLPVKEIYEKRERLVKSSDSEVLRLYLLVSDVNLGDSGSVSGDISQISGMTDCVGWATVFLSVWVEVRSSAHAAIGSITEFVNVESVLSGFQAFNRAGHLNGIGVRLKVNIL